MTNCALLLPEKYTTILCGPIASVCHSFCAFHLLKTGDRKYKFCEEITCDEYESQVISSQLVVGGKVRRSLQQ